MNYLKYFYIKKIRLYLFFIFLSSFLCGSDDIRSDNSEVIVLVKKHEILKNFYNDYKKNQNSENFSRLVEQEDMKWLLNEKNDDGSTILHKAIDGIMGLDWSDNKREFGATIENIRSKLFYNDILQQFAEKFPLLLTKKKETYVGNSKVQLSPFFYLLDLMRDNDI